MAADPLWEAFVTLALPMGAVSERPSRYAEKPALCIGSREVAHRDGPGLIDLRITSAGWRAVSASFAHDAAVTRETGRRDWNTLRLRSHADLDRVTPLARTTVAGLLKPNHLAAPRVLRSGQHVGWMVRGWVWPAPVSVVLVSASRPWSIVTRPVTSRCS